MAVVYAEPIKESVEIVVTSRPVSKNSKKSKTTDAKKKPGFGVSLGNFFKNKLLKGLSQKVNTETSEQLKEVVLPVALD